MRQHFAHTCMASKNDAAKDLDDEIEDAVGKIEIQHYQKSIM